MRNLGYQWWLLVGVVVLGVFLAPRFALSEQATSFSLTETLIFEWHGETDSRRPTSAEGAHDRDNYLTLKNRANMGARRGPLDFTFRWDQSAFWPTCDQMPEEGATVADVQGCRSPRDSVHENDIRLERATARLRLGRHRLFFGDFPLQVGRGIALSLRKVSEFGIDDALRGIRTQLRLHDSVRMDLFGGVINISNLDDVTDTLLEDPRDRVVGGSIDGRILDIANVSAHGLMLFPQSADGESNLDLNGGEWTAVVGGTLEFPGLWDRLSLFIEADGLLRSLADPDGPEGDERASMDEGFALYSTMDLQLGRVTLLGELKWFDNYEVIGTVYQQVGDDAVNTPRPLSSPPTIEREDQPVSNNRDVLGGRLRLDVRLPAGFLVYGNVSLVNGRAVDAPNSFHGYFGMEYRLLDGRISGTISGGYRREFGDETYDGASSDDILTDPDWDWDNLTYTIYHGEANLAVRIVGRHSAHLAVLHETWNKPAFGEDHYSHRGTITLGYDYGSMLSISVAYEYDTQFHQNTYYVEDPEAEEPGYWEVPTSVRQHFAFAEVRYTPLRWLDLRLRGGTQRGGLRCLSGVCRQFPNFTGVRFESVFRF